MPSNVTHLPQSNVVRFHGAMHPRRALPVPAAAPKLTEAELDAQISANRERFDEHFEALVARLDRGRTGWPPGLLQDDSRPLSNWLAGRVDSRQHAREAADSIRGGAPARPSLIALDTGWLARAMRWLRGVRR